MSFQAYLNTIKIKTGKTPDDLRAYAVEKGWMLEGALAPDIKASTIVADLAQHLDLGHGHAMAVYALLKGKRKEEK